MGRTKAPAPLPADWPNRFQSHRLDEHYRKFTSYRARFGHDPDLPAEPGVDAAARGASRCRMRPLQPIAPRVRRALNEVAVRFAPRGVRLFVFGSAAPRWPSLPSGADLDIGFTIAAPPAADRAALSREVRRALDELPTVRPIDVVDFDLAAPEFAHAARRGARILPDEHA